LQITVYSTPKCVQCKLTKGWLDERGITYRAVDLSQHPEDLEAVQALGYASAPVVIVSAGDPETDIMWSGLHVDNLTKYTHSTNQEAAA
jgi:glutaredoxin-like protein NrdH